jgi:predicted nucleic acid-binding protein
VALILDSSVFIGAERKGKNLKEALTEIALQLSGQDIAVSVVTLVELAHGAARANTAERKAKREQFVGELIAAVPVHPVTIAVALRAGQIDGENDARGIQLALADLLIGVTALELGYQLGTANVRHFKMVPGLEIYSF